MKKLLGVAPANTEDAATKAYVDSNIGGGDMVLADVQTVTGLKTFNKDKLAMKGTSTGVTTVSTANASATDYTATLQAGNGTLAFTSDITGTNSGTNTGDQDLSTYVVGPASSTNKALAVFDETTGKLIQDSLITVALGASGLSELSAHSGTFGGASAPDVPNGVITNIISERTANTGVTIDGVLLKDSAVVASNIPAGASVSGSNTGDETTSTIKTKLGAATAAADGYATSTQITKLDGIEAGADITDTTNVTSAGALMDSEVDADLKTLSLPANTTITAAAATALDDATVADMVNTLGGASSTGTGGLVRATSPTLVTPALGTPSSGTLTNCTGLPTAGILDDAVTAAKMANGMVKHRQGGTTGDNAWNTKGTSNTDTSAKAVRIQVGAAALSTEGGTVTITFPEAFNQVPLVFCQISTAVSANVFVEVRSISTTQFTCVSILGNGSNETFSWLAIGQ
jgi:hypothetical protein